MHSKSIHLMTDFVVASFLLIVATNCNEKKNINEVRCICM